MTKPLNSKLRTKNQELRTIFTLSILSTLGG